MSPIMNRSMIIILALAALLVAGPVGHGQAQSDSRVSLQPVASSDSTVTVDVVAENVADLYGVEFRLKFDPAAVSVQDVKPEQAGVQIEAGTFLPVDQGFVVVNQVDQANGAIAFAMTLLNPAPPVSGSGPLAQITFDLLQNRPSQLEVTDVKLVAANLQIIQAETSPLTIDTTNLAATPNSDFPWWIVAGGIMVIGLAVLGFFVVMGSFNPTPRPQKKSQPATPAPAQENQPQPTTPPTTPPSPTSPKQTRPSAFKKSYR